MKAIRFMMMAVMAVFVGTGFVSCLDDGENRPVYQGFVLVDQYLVKGDYLKTLDGLTLLPTNPSAFQTLNPDGETIMYPDAAYVIFSTVDDVPFPQEGVSSYNIEVQRVYFYDLKSLETNPVNPVSPYTSISEVGEVGNYVCFNAYCKFKKFDVRNHRMYIEKVENQTIYLTLVSTEDGIENLNTASTISVDYAFAKPSKSYLENNYEGFEVPADGKVSLQITAKGISTEVGATQYPDQKSETIKITIE